MTRTRIAIVAVAAAAVIVALVVWTARRSTTTGAADGPIILFSIDTLRADRLPAYGYTAIRTPHIDRLAADGVLFENAYSHAPQTLPAHASMLSGKLPFEHGVRDNIGFSVRQGQRFVQHALKERGFTTGAFVSAYVLRRQTGIGQGFDVYDDDLPAAAPDRPLGQVQRPGSETVAAAIRWIDGQGSSKFFAFVHIYEPHTPYSPPEEFGARDPYDGEVQHADAIVGQLVDHLRAKNLYDKATIVLLSDHGEGLGDHGEDEHGIFLYRETIRVPLIIKLPSSRERGRRVGASVQHIDLPPTLLDLAGAAAPQDSRGRSLRPVLDGSRTLADAGIYSESLSPRYHFGWSELYALTDDRYRLIRAPRDELYDLQQDPGERASVADARPQARSAMRRALDGIIAKGPVDAPSTVTAEDRQRLAALGYVGTQSSVSPARSGDELPDPKDKVGVLQKYKRATGLASSGRHAEAIVLYREILAAEPQMTDVWLQLGNLHTKRGAFADAVAAFREVIERNPKDPAALTGAAASLVRIGRIDEARVHAELAIDTAPVTAHELLARIAAHTGHAAEARRHAQLASAADPTLPMPAFIEGLLLYNQGQFAAALPHFVNALQSMSQRTEQMGDVNFLAGDALARLERHAEAERYFRAELAVAPGHVRARAGLAILYQASGRDADAERAISDLIRYSPTIEGYDTAARLWTVFGHPDRAAALRAEARRIPR